MRQGRRSDDRGVRDLDTVVDLVALFQAAQDCDRILDGRLIDQHFLKPALECAVLFQVLAVFVERRRADAVEFAPRQRGFQHIAGIHGPLRLSGAHHGVKFVDEQDDLTFLLGEVRFSTAFRRSSNSPRNFAPAISAPMSRDRIRLLRNPSGISLLTMRCARPSIIAVLPTPGSPIRTGLFLVRRCNIWMVRRISSSRPDDRIQLALFRPFR